MTLFWHQTGPLMKYADGTDKSPQSAGLHQGASLLSGVRPQEAVHHGRHQPTDRGAVYLPPIVVAALANHPRGLDRKGRLFRFHDGGRFRDMLKEACKLAGIELPRRTAYHVFRHNYGTWMRRYAGLDGLGLTRTGVWADAESVDRYSHSEATEEAMQAVNLPTPTRGVSVEPKARKA